MNLLKYSALPLWPVVFTIMAIDKIIDLRRNRYAFRIVATLVISIVFYLSVIYFGTTTVVIYFLINLLLTGGWCRVTAIKGGFERPDSTIEAMKVAVMLVCTGTILVAAILVSETEMHIYNKKNGVSPT